MQHPADLVAEMLSVRDLLSIALAQFSRQRQLSFDFKRRTASHREKMHELRARITTVTFCDIADD